MVLYSLALDVDFLTSPEQVGITSSTAPTQHSSSLEYNYTGPNSYQVDGLIIDDHHT